MDWWNSVQYIQCFMLNTQPGKPGVSYLDCVELVPLTRGNGATHNVTCRRRMSYARLRQDEEPFDDDIELTEVAVDDEPEPDNNSSDLGKTQPSKVTGTDECCITLLQVGQPQRQVAIEADWTVLDLKRAHFLSVSPHKERVRYMCSM